MLRKIPISAPLFRYSYQLHAVQRHTIKLIVYQAILATKPLGYLHTHHFLTSSVKRIHRPKAKWEEKIFNRSRSGIDCILDARNIKKDKDDTNCKCNSGEEPEVLSPFAE
jgi:hypothetical protein